MPAHTMLARLGKRVLRPGGIELTRGMLAGLRIGPSDHVVEFGPGMGATAELALAARPVSYTAIERDASAARRLAGRMTGAGRQCLRRPAHDTGLPNGSATIVYAEAMATMETDDGKRRILAEVHRLLVPGGRLGLHELTLVPGDLDDEDRADVQRQLTRSLRVRARPLTGAEWHQLLEAAGFRVDLEQTAPMNLLRLRRVVRDEGLGRTLRFVSHAVRHPEALRRLRDIRRTFQRHHGHLAATAIVATKLPTRVAPPPG